MQHLQTLVEPHIHLKKKEKKNVMQALLHTVKIPQLLASPVVVEINVTEVTIV